MRSAHGENGTTSASPRYDDAVPRGKRPMGILPNVLRITCKPAREPSNPRTPYTLGLTG